jgi:hypothetical protein
MGISAATRGNIMSTITVTAELCPTGLHQISTLRNGVMHAARWVDVGGDGTSLTLAVVKAAREAVGDSDYAVILSTAIDYPQSYVMTVEIP